MNSAKYYPAEVYNKRIDITRENMRRYDAAQAKIEKAILEKYPDYYKMPFIERHKIRAEIREIESRYPWY